MPTSARPPARPLSYESLAAYATKLGRTSDPLVRDRLAHLYSVDHSGVLLSQRMRQEVDAGQDLRALERDVEALVQLDAAAELLDRRAGVALGERHLAERVGERRERVGMTG